MKYILALISFLFLSAADAQSVPFTTDYELVAASQTTQVIGPQSATSTLSVGDILEEVLIIPEATTAGTVAIKDGGDTAINIFITGTLVDTKPFVVKLGARSRSGAWQITTGASVHAIAIGRFK